MIQELPVMNLPGWLAVPAFPLQDILTNSLYYPASGFDGRPVKHLGCNVNSFVYADWHITEQELDQALEHEGFAGYHRCVDRNVTAHELPLDILSRMYFGAHAPEMLSPPFARWLILERNKSRTENYGPLRFSLLFVCGEGAAIYWALYKLNKIKPMVIAVVQPGCANAFDFRNPESRFARLVNGNPLEAPYFLLNGPNNQSDWPDQYGLHVRTIQEDGNAFATVWAQQNRQTRVNQWVQERDQHLAQGVAAPQEKENDGGGRGMNVPSLKAEWLEGEAKKLVSRANEEGYRKKNPPSLRDWYVMLYKTGPDLFRQGAMDGWERHQSHAIVEAAMRLL